MGQIHAPEPVKLFSGILSSLPDIMEEAEEGLACLFGPVDLRSPIFPFEETCYYNREMGSPIKRRFIAFANLISPSELAAAKTATNRLEAAIAEKCATMPRPVNLDPGYIEQSKIVLASTKNFYHRIYLSDGVYAEVTMRFVGKVWQSFPWTFPDFMHGRYDEFFLSLRRHFRAQLSA